MVGNAAALGSGGLVLNGGLLDLNANSITVRSLSGFGGTISDKNSAGGTSTLTVNQFTTTSFSGTLADGPTRQLRDLQPAAERLRSTRPIAIPAAPRSTPARSWWATPPHSAPAASFSSAACST